MVVQRCAPRQSIKVRKAELCATRGVTHRKGKKEPNNATQATVAPAMSFEWKW